MPSYVGDPRPSMLQLLPPWVPRPLGAPEDVGRCRKHWSHFFEQQMGVGHGSMSQKGQDKDAFEKDIKALSRPLHKYEYEYPIRPICFVPYKSLYSVNISLDKVFLSLKFEESCSPQYWTSPAQLCQEKGRTDQDISSFSVISSWNAGVPCWLFRITPATAKTATCRADMRRWVMFWRASWLNGSIKFCVAKKNSLVE